MGLDVLVETNRQACSSQLTRPGFACDSGTGGRVQGVSSRKRLMCGLMGTVG